MKARTRRRLTAIFANLSEEGAPPWLCPLVRSRGHGAPRSDTYANRAQGAHLISQKGSLVFFMIGP